jgi:tRNA/rRNA methyltransferase
MGYTERGPVALVFGREDKGLFNEEVALCSHLIQIPTSTAYTSLNLSQAVMVCCYELFCTEDSYEAIEEKSDIAPAGHRQRMFELWRDLLLTVGFMEPEKADHMMQGLRRILSRGALTEDDVRIMMGIARQCDWGVYADPDEVAEVAARNGVARET